MSGLLLPQRVPMLALVVAMAAAASSCQGLGAAVSADPGTELSAPAVDESSPSEVAISSAEGPRDLTATPVPDAVVSPKADPESVSPSAPTGASVAGAVAPDWTLRDLHGTEVALSALRGKAVLLNFWATW